MSRSSFLTIHAILAVAFGVGLILGPAQTAAMYGNTVDAFAASVLRLLGSSFLAIGGIAWLARGSEDGKGLRAILGGMALGVIAGFVASLYAQLQGVSNALGWSTVAIYLFLSVGYLFFFARKSRA